MRKSQFPPSVLAAALSACATESVILNSERIEQRFGSYGIEVLASEAGLRRSSLFSLDGDTATCRTYAVVQFDDEAEERDDEAHSRVLAGDSIGATFKDNGWGIRKHTLFIGNVRLPEGPTEIAKLMRLTGSHDLALHVYQVVLLREDASLEYATIMELHHPEYLTASELRDIFEYDEADVAARFDVNSLSELLFAAENRN